MERRNKEHIYVDSNKKCRSLTVRGKSLVIPPLVDLKIAQFRSIDGWFDAARSTNGVRHIN